MGDLFCLKASESKEPWTCSCAAEQTDQALWQETLQPPALQWKTPSPKVVASEVGGPTCRHHQSSPAPHGEQNEAQALC